MNFVTCDAHLATTQRRGCNFPITPASPLRPLWVRLAAVPTYGNPVSVLSGIPACHLSRPKYTCSTKTKHSRDKNNTFSSVGDPVIPPNWRLSRSECARDTDLLFLLPGFVPMALCAVSMSCHQACFSYSSILVTIQHSPRVWASNFLWCSTPETKSDAREEWAVLGFMGDGLSGSMVRPDCGILKESFESFHFSYCMLTLDANPGVRCSCNVDITRWGKGGLEISWLGTW